MNKRHFIAALAATLVLATGCTTTGPSAGDPATRRQNIDSGVDNALARLYQQAPGSEQLVRSAKGVLVFPAVLEAGFVFGAWQGRRRPAQGRQDRQLSPHDGRFVRAAGRRPVHGGFPAVHDG